jgi:hypothetical protein
MELGININNSNQIIAYNLLHAMGVSIKVISFIIMFL